MCIRDRDGFTLVKSLIQEEAGVAYHGGQAVAVLQEVVHNFVHVECGAVVDFHQHFVLSTQGAFHFLTEDGFVKNVLDADTNAVNFVGVAGANTAASGANGALTEEAFGGFIDGLVVGPYEVGIRADAET